eukprot:616850-Prymnesium_polylepis.1
MIAASCAPLHSPMMRTHSSSSVPKPARAKTAGASKGAMRVTGGATATAAAGAHTARPHRRGHTTPVAVHTHTTTALPPQTRPHPYVRTTTVYPPPPRTHHHRARTTAAPLAPPSLGRSAGAPFDASYSRTACCRASARSTGTSGSAAGGGSRNASSSASNSARHSSRTADASV